MKVLIILLIIFIIYQVCKYLIVLYNRSILPIYYSHGELVNRYARYICNIDKNRCIVYSLTILNYNQYELYRSK